MLLLYHNHIIATACLWLAVEQLKLKVFIPIPLEYTLFIIEFTWDINKFMIGFIVSSCMTLILVCYVYKTRLSDLTLLLTYTAIIQRYA